MQFEFLMPPSLVDGVILSVAVLVDLQLQLGASAARRSEGSPLRRSMPREIPRPAGKNAGSSG